MTANFNQTLNAWSAFGRYKMEDVSQGVAEGVTRKPWKMTQKWIVFRFFGEQLGLSWVQSVTRKTWMSSKCHQRPCVKGFMWVQKWRVFIKDGRECKHRTHEKGLKMAKSAIHPADTDVKFKFSFLLTRAMSYQERARGRGQKTRPTSFFDVSIDFSMSVNNLVI